MRWIKAGDGLWEDVANWVDDKNLQRLPVGGDQVVIDVANIQVTIRHSVGVISLASLVCQENLIIDGGSAVAVAGDSMIGGALTLADGELRGAGNVDVRGQFLWTGGTLSGKAKLSANGGMTISGSGQKILDGRTLANAGQALVQAGVRGRNGGGFDNLAGGTFEIRAGDNDALYLGDVVFYNRAGATLRRTGSTNSTQLEGYVTNDGLVEVETGGFTLTTLPSFGMGRSTNSGQFVATAANAGRLDLGYLNLTSSASIAAKRVNLGHVRMEGTYNVTQSTDTGEGDVVFAGTITNLGENLGIGDVTTFSLAQTPTFTVKKLGVGGPLTRGVLAGSANFQVTERFLWTGRGDLRGSGRIDIAQGARFDIDDARESKELDGWEIHNAGTGLWTARDNIYLANALIVNEASGVIEVTGTNLLRRGDSPVRFENYGIFRKTGAGGGGVATPMINDGLVEVTQGELGITLVGGGVSRGTFKGALGTRLELYGDSGTHTLAVESSIDGDEVFVQGMRIEGTYLARSSTGASGVNMTGTVLGLGSGLGVESFEFAPRSYVAAKVSLENLSIGPGALSSGGALRLSGVLHLGPHTNSIISGSSSKVIDGTTIVNEGHVIWSGTGEIQARQRRPLPQPVQRHF